MQNIQAKGNHSKTKHHSHERGNATNTE